MKHLIFFFLLCVISNGAVAQKIPESIQNKQTAAHVNVPGTRVSLIPQKSYKLGTNFVGFGKGDAAMIMVMELIGGNFYSNSRSMTPTAFDEKGFRTLEYKNLTVNGYPAILLHVDNLADRKMYMLTFGDTTFSTLIMGQYYREDTESGKEILKMLTTVAYDIDLKIDPLELAPFTLDTAGTQLRFSKYVANTYMYTPGGVEADSVVKSPTLMVMVFPREGLMTSKMMADGTIGSLQQHGFSELNFPVADYIELNGDSAYETEGTGKLKENQALLYVLVVRHGDKFVMMQGIASDNFDTMRTEFRKLAHSIRFK